MKKSLYITAFFLFAIAVEASAKIYIWVGGPQKQDLYWKNSASWNPPGDGTCPGTKEDTAQFGALAVSGCVLSADTEIKSIQCLPGFTKTFHFYVKKLTVSGDADFSNGKIIASRGELVFTGEKGENQQFKLQAGMVFNSVQMTGSGAVDVTGAPLTAGILAIKSGTWRWGPGTHTISKDFAVTGKANMVLRNNVTLNILAAYANFGGLGTLELGTGDTLCFSAKGETQLFNPRRGVLFPPIKKTNKGTVTLTAIPLNAGSLVVEGGTWDWASSVLPDTVASITANGGACSMNFSNRTVVISRGDADLSGIVKLNAGSGVLDFAGAEDQYFIPAQSDDPRIRHSGTGLLFRGSRNKGRAVLDKSSATTPVFFASDKVMLRAKVLSVEAGMNFYGQSFTTFSRADTIGRTGMAVGIFLPIKVPKVLLWYHVKVLFHGTTSRKNGPMKYWAGVNEVLVGKPLLVKHLPFEYTPLAGIGLTEGIKIKNDLSDFFLYESHPYLFTSLGILVRNRSVHNSDIRLHGVLCTWEHGFFGAIDSRMRYGLTAVYGF